MRSIYLKELYLYFASPIFYALAFIFILIFGIFFYNGMTSISILAARIAQMQVETSFTLADVVLRPLFDSMGILVLFLVPVISMRLFAEEKAQGTIELLFTYPISDAMLLLGKYLAAVTVMAIMLALSLPHMFIIGVFTPQDWGVVLTSYAGMLLMGGSFLALGVFASSISRNQIVAAVLALGLVILFWVIGGFANAVSGGPLGAFLQEISLLEHLSSFFKGMFMLKDIVFYLCFIAFFLFLTLRSLESHTWRG